MPRSPVIDNENITVWDDAEKQMVSHCFHRPTTGANFREALLAGVELMRRKGYTKWLSDDRLNLNFPEEDIQWILEVWRGRAVAAGWKFWALVPPEDMHGQMDMQALIDDFGKVGVIVRVFSDPELGLIWLQNCAEREIDRDGSAY